MSRCIPGTAIVAMDQKPPTSEPVENGLYTLTIEMSHGKQGRATGVVVLCDGRIMGGDTFFYYTGSYTHKIGKWRGEMIVNQHTEAQKRHAESRHIPPREASAKRERPHESGGSARHT